MTLAHLDLVLSGILCHLQDLVIVYNSISALFSILATSSGGFTGAHESRGRGLVTPPFCAERLLIRKKDYVSRIWRSVALGCAGRGLFPQRHCNTRQHVWLWIQLFLFLLLCFVHAGPWCVAKLVWCEERSNVGE